MNMLNKIMQYIKIGIANFNSYGKFNSYFAYTLYNFFKKVLSLEGAIFILYKFD